MPGCPRPDEAAMFSAVKSGEPWSVEMVVIRRGSDSSVFDSSILHANGARTETCFCGETKQQSILTIKGALVYGTYKLVQSYWGTRKKLRETVNKGCYCHCCCCCYDVVAGTF